MLKIIYEDSFEGFLTAIYYSFYRKDQVASISTKDKLEINLFSETEYINADLNKYSKVKNATVSRIDPLTLNKIYKLYLSNYKNKGLLCFKYLKIAFKLGSDVHKYLHLDTVRKLDLIDRRVSLEGHRFTGFVRLISVNDDFLCFSIEPDNNILEIISPHSQGRLSNEYWIIHDIKRNVASVHNETCWEIKEVDIEIYNDLKNYDDNFQDLWKGYFKSTTINKRISPKLQKRMMPKRYWNSLTEIE